MELQFKNLGTIKTGKINLDKRLTLLVGPNNTGKSYATYVIYGLYKIFDINHPSAFNSILSKHLESKIILPDYFKNNVFIVDLPKIFAPLKEIIPEAINKTLNTILPEVFAKPNLKNVVKFSSNLLNDNDFDDFVYKESFDLPLQISDFKIRIFKIKGEPEIKIVFSDAISNTDKQDLSKYLNVVLSSIFFEILKKFFSDVYFFPAERSAINILSKDIISEKARRNDILHSSFLTGSTIELLKNQIYKSGKQNKYTLPIRDYLYFINDIEKIAKSPGKYANFANEIESTILNGKIEVIENGEIFFNCNSENERIDFHLASSLVKSLSGIVIYFRYIANKGDCIIIDEPEINLHPDNQIKFARVIAMIVNKGFKVIISTHSDYIVRELNNLIILGSAGTKAKKLILKYKLKNDFLLNKNVVNAYLFKDNKIEEIPLKQSGIEVTTIDNTINQLNSFSQDIYFTLFE